MIGTLYASRKDNWFWANNSLNWQVDVAELRQKLQTMETLQKELELLQRQKAASEQAALNAKRQSSGGMWGWLAGAPPTQNAYDA